MRVHDLAVSELLSFQPDDGKIVFSNQRSLLIEAEALGTLRKDLVSSLGMERTKGFLMRYGWHCGSNYAKRGKKTSPSAEESDWLHTGLKIHGLTGNALAVPIEIRSDPVTGELYYEGIWFNSYEAEQHIKHFGYHHEPVCSTLIGYAGGFTSEYLGRKVIYVETECIGKGDPHCRWVGRSLEHWGDKIGSELRFYEDENLAIELDRAYHRIEKQKDELKNILSINEKLSNILIQGGGLSTIVKVLGQNLRTTVVLEDKNFNPLETYGDCQPHDFMKFLQSQAGKQGGLNKRLFEEKRTMHFSIPEHFGWQHERLISPILLKNEVCGYLSLIKQQHIFDEMEVISLERAAMICAVQFLNERTAIETEQRMRGEFLHELLLENADVGNLSYRMKLMGYDLDKPHYVFLFGLKYSKEGRGQPQESYLAELREKLADAIQKQLKSYAKGCFVSNSLDKIVALVPEEMMIQRKTDPKSFGELVVQKMNVQDVGFRITLGISSLCKGIDTFRNGYEEAGKAIGMAYSGAIKSNVIYFNELGSLGKILLHANDSNELKNFALGLLKDIVAYDQEHEGELLKTLNAFLGNQGNIHQTAREMMVSIGAIRYRLKRIQEISTLDLTSSKDFFDAHLALQMLMFYGILEM